MLKQMHTIDVTLIHSLGRSIVANERQTVCASLQIRIAKVLVVIDTAIKERDLEILAIALRLDKAVQCVFDTFNNAVGQILIRLNR